MRYAIYYCPGTHTALGRLGREWLSEALSLPGISSQRHQVLLADVRRYGWHATIHAPFAPRSGASYGDVRSAITALAENFAAFELTLRLDRLAGFLSLRPVVDGIPERALAAACLTTLQPIRASLPDEALQRRRAGLDKEELAHLQKHGYPYVLDRYRFHLTLAAPATEWEELAMRRWLQPRMAALPPARIDALAICREAAPGRSFELLERVALRSERAP
jgi:hypothetical protein